MCRYGRLVRPLEILLQSVTLYFFLPGVFFWLEKTSDRALRNAARVSKHLQILASAMRRAPCFAVILIWHGVMRQHLAVRDSSVYCEQSNLSKVHFTSLHCDRLTVGLFLSSGRAVITLIRALERRILLRQCSFMLRKEEVTSATGRCRTRA